MNARLRRLPLLVVFLVALFFPHYAHASPGEDRLIDRYEEGDIDREDFAMGGATSRGGSWVSLSTFDAEYDRGTRAFGAMALVGVAFDRIAVHPTSSVESRGTYAINTGGAIPTHPGLPVTSRVARRAVAAAWRTAGLGADDARIDAMVSRAHWSSLLPETRLRAMRRFDEAASPELPPSSGYTDTAHLWLEARLTWRLDRMLYADDEPALEHVRLNRSEARGRLATRVLSILAQWQRAWVEAKSASPESPDALDANLRLADAEATLDVLTGGWFNGWRASLRDS